jgi:hypothetical protein
MKASRRASPKSAPRAAHARAVRRSPRATAAAGVEIRLPAAQTERIPRGGSVALVDFRGDRLKLRFLREAGLEDEAGALTGPEAAALARGGVVPVSDEEARRVLARAAAAHERLRSTSLTVDQAAKRLQVNTSRVRQRLAERSLYGLKDAGAWLLPAFQFVAQGLVPGIEVVLRRLPEGISPQAVARWFAIPNPDLCTRDDEERPLTPLQWLLAGNPPSPAAELAAAL